MDRKHAVVWVVAGLLVDESGQWLMQQRPPGKAHAGEWEFPGGKVESGESPRAALARELAEELGIGVAEVACRPVAFADQPDGPIAILLYEIAEWQGVACSGEGGEIAWFAPDKIANLPLPPLDRQLLNTILPATGAR